MQQPQSTSFRDRLGHNTWKFFETLVEGYPERASAETQRDMKDFILLLAKLYPCETCRAAFQLYVSEFPPRTCCREHLYRYFLVLRYLINGDA